MTKRLTAQERRTQILHSAIKVFAEDTYHGATTKKISERAGITEALIYRYFGSKRKLFTEAIEHTSDALITGIEETLRTHRDDPFEAIRMCFQYYIDVLERHSELAKMIFLVLAELDSGDVRDTYLPHQERILKAISEAIEYWRTQGFLEESAGLSPKTGAWLYYGTYLILALVKHSHGNVALDVNFAVELSKPYFTKALVEREEARQTSSD